ncbi:Coiled-coil domain-containing protein 39 [Irineochytrium annulatum]|nr:Coiled-coil domain-containing protein 39 [Irineochytrium annulatum]
MLARSQNGLAIRPSVGDDNLHVHSLPPFANAQNKSLSVDIREKESKFTSLVAVHDDSTSRTDAMLAHLKNVQQEIMHTQGVYDAKTRQIETEDHFKQIAERESGRLALEIKRMEKEIADITDHLNTIQNNIYRGNERIETIRTELKLEKEELDEWLRVQTEKEEDNFALLKYTKEDDQRIKELNLATEKLMQDVNKKKAVLSAEVTETQVAQIELDKTTEEFRALHLERQDLITQWENAIKTMQKRDGEISNAQDRYQKSKDNIREKQSHIDEKQAFLDAQNSNNAEMEKKIGVADRLVSKHRMELSELQASYVQFQDEVEVMRTTLSKSSTDLVNKKNELANLKKDLQDKQGKLEKEKGRKASMRDKLARVTGDTMSLEAKANELQEILKAEEARSKDLDRELKIVRETHFKKNQELFRLRQEEKNIHAEITGGEAAIRNLKTTIHRLDQEALKQQALLYAQEFNIQQLERKVRRALGDRTDDEKDLLLKRIEELNAELEDQTRKHVLLNNQLKKSHEDLRQAKRKMDSLQKEKDDVTDAIDELNLYTESASNQLNVKVREKEDLMVEENILRLELRKLRGFLNAKADEASLNLETRQVSLQLALEERTKEISIHNDMLRLQTKNVEEERHSANAELRERVGRVEKLKRRYEILMTQFAPEEGEEEHSQAFYVIKSAQEKEALQREGDELDAKIRKAEREIKALENTLKLMNDRNEDYRMNIYKAELNSSDVQHKEMLEQQYRTAMEKYKEKRNELQALQHNLMNLERTLSAMNQDEAARTQAVAVIENKLASMEKELKEKDEKKERAWKQAIRSAKELKKSGVDITADELDFRIRECKDLGTTVLSEITRVMEQYPEITNRVTELYSERDLTPPSRPLSRVPSRSSSIRDDMSEASFRSKASSRASSRASAINLTLGGGVGVGIGGGGGGMATGLAGGTHSRASTGMVSNMSRAASGSMSSLGGNKLGTTNMNGACE